MPATDAPAESLAIGEAAERLGLPVSTLRYYDREGIVPGVERDAAGRRVFTARSLRGMRLVECLKHSGLQIPEIRQYMDWAAEGDATLEDRRELIRVCREELRTQLASLQEVLGMADYKVWYYDTAIGLGSEEAVHRLPAEQVPEHLRGYHAPGPDRLAGPSTPPRDKDTP